MVVTVKLTDVANGYKLGWVWIEQDPVYTYTVTVSNAYEDIHLTNINFCGNEHSEVVPHFNSDAVVVTWTNGSGETGTAKNEGPVQTRGKGHVDFNFQVQPGYRLVDVKLDGASRGAVSSLRVTDRSSAIQHLDIETEVVSYSVTYDSAGENAQVPTDSGTYAINGQTNIVVGSAPTGYKGNKIFLGWKLGNKTYMPGDVVDLSVAAPAAKNGTITFIAQWGDGLPEGVKIPLTINVYLQNANGEYDLNDTAEASGFVGTRVSVVNPGQCVPEDCEDCYALNVEKSNTTLVPSDESGTEFNLYFDRVMKDVSYSVEYYKDGVKDKEASYTRTEEVWVHDKIDTIEIEGEIDTSDNKYKGYSLEKTDPGDLPNAGTPVKSGSVYKVYYVANDYTATYQFTSDTASEPVLPADMPALPEADTAKYGQTVTIDPADYKDVTDGRGTWEFLGWTVAGSEEYVTEFAMPVNGTTVTGHWQLVPDTSADYTATYQFTSDTASEPVLPADMPALPEADTAKYGQTVTIDPADYKDVTDGRGTWEFLGWTVAGSEEYVTEFAMPVNGTTVTGHWQLVPDTSADYTATYQFTSDTASEPVLPADMPALPEADTAKYGQTVTIDPADYKDVTDGRGTWEFLGWTVAGSEEYVTEFAMPVNGTTVTGHWQLVPDTSADYTATYQFTSDTASEPVLPADMPALPEADTAKYGQTVTIDPADYKDVTDGRGTWEFLGWTVAGSEEYVTEFAMPVNGTTVTGHWQLVPDTSADYTATYQFTSDTASEPVLPADMPALPEADTAKYGQTVTIDPADYKDVTDGRGTWEFLGWTVAGSEEYVTEFAMPVNGTTVTGHWQLVPDTSADYTATYQFTSDTASEPVLPADMPALPEADTAKYGQTVTIDPADYKDVTDGRGTWEFLGWTVAGSEEYVTEFAMPVNGTTVTGHWQLVPDTSADYTATYQFTSDTASEPVLPADMPALPEADTAKYGQTVTIDPADYKDVTDGRGTWEFLGWTVAGSEEYVTEFAMPVNGTTVTGHWQLVPDTSADYTATYQFTSDTASEPVLPADMPALPEADTAKYGQTVTIDPADYKDVTDGRGTWEFLGWTVAGSEEYVTEFAMPVNGTTVTGHWQLAVVNIGSDLIDVSMPSDSSYNGADQTWAPTVTDAEGNLLTAGEDYEVSYSTDDRTNVTGIITVTITGKGNYSGTITREYQITPLAINVYIENQTKVEGEADPTFTFNYEGVLEGESMGWTGAFVRDAGEAAGTYNVAQGGFVLADNEAGNFLASNYTLTVHPGTLTITAAPVPPGPDGPDTPVTPVTPLPTPDPTPVPTPTPGDPGATDTPEIEEATATIEDDATPMADRSTASIDDDATPMAAGAHRDCWVHWLMLLGILVTVVYYGGVGVRRVRFSSSLQSFEDDVLGNDETNR